MTGVAAGVVGLDGAGLSGAGLEDGAGVAIMDAGGDGTETAAGVVTGVTTGGAGVLLCVEAGVAGVDIVDTVSTTLIRMHAFGP